MTFKIEPESLKSKDDATSLTDLARFLESSELYHDMCGLMKQLVIKSPELDVEQRNLLSIAYKNVVGPLRCSLRKISCETEVKGEAGHISIDKQYIAKQTTGQLQSRCREVLDLLEKNILAKIDKKNSEPHVFFLKMAADYYRYLAETDEKYAADAKKYYQDAYDLAKIELSETHPTRLILRQPEEALRLANAGFNDAVKKLETLEERDYEDSTLIMQLLRDNITLWTSDSDVLAADKAQEKEEDSEIVHKKVDRAAQAG